MVALLWRVWCGRRWGSSTWPVGPSCAPATKQVRPFTLSGPFVMSVWHGSSGFQVKEGRRACKGGPGGYADDLAFICSLLFFCRLGNGRRVLHREHAAWRGGPRGSRVTMTAFSAHLSRPIPSPPLPNTMTHHIWDKMVLRIGGDSGERPGAGRRGHFVYT